MTVVLSDAARQYIARFEDHTGATARDCVVEDDDDTDRVILVVKPGDMARAIGPGGKLVQELEEQFGKRVLLVEDAETPEEFVANALAPAVVNHVTISENDTTIAYVEVDSDDTGVAIGTDGRNIAAAKLLADRHFDIDDIQLT